MTSQKTKLTQQAICLWAIFLVYGLLVVAGLSTLPKISFADDMVPEEPALVLTSINKRQAKLLGSGPYNLSPNLVVVNKIPGMANYPVSVLLPAVVEIEWVDLDIKRITLLAQYKDSVAE